MIYPCIRKKTFPLRAFIVILILADFHCFYLFKYPPVIERYLGSANRLWVLGFIGIILYIYYRGASYLKKTLHNNFFYVYIPATICAALILIIYTQFAYPMQTLNDTLRLSGQYLWYPQIFIYLYLFVHDGNEKRIIRMLNNIALVWYIVLIVQYFSYQAGGSIIFDLSSSFTNEIITRDAGIRISLRSIANFMIIQNYFDFYTTQSKRLLSKLNSLFRFFSGCFCLIFVQQTRGYILVIVGAIIIITLIGNDTTSKKIKAAIICVVCAVYILSSGALDTFFGSFALTAEYGGSTLARVGSLEYYWNTFLTNPIFGGVGLAAEQYYYSLVHGPTGLSYIDDVGIIGIMATIGVFSILFYCLPILRILKVGMEVYKMDRRRGTYIYAILIYLLLSTASLIIVNQQRCVLFPILISLVEYVRLTVVNDANKLDDDINFN